MIQKKVFSLVRPHLLLTLDPVFTFFENFEGLTPF